MFGAMRALIHLILGICVLQANGQDASLVGQAVLAAPAAMAAEPAIISKSISIKVMDMNTKEPVPFFTIDFTSCGHPVYESNEKGLFAMETVEGFSCYVRIAKSGYTNLDLLLDYREILGSGKTYNVYLSRSPNHFTGYVKDVTAGNLYLDNVKVELVALQDHQIQKAVSNRQGQFSLYLRPNTKYRLSISRQDYKPFEKNFQTGKKVDPYIIKNILLTPLVTNLQPVGISAGLSVTKKESAHSSREVQPKYYSIQILAKKEGKIDVGTYKNTLQSFGEVYVESDGEIDRLKVGKFFDRGIAEQTLTKIKKSTPFVHAFLSQHVPLQKAENGKDFVGERYMVRLASYLNPDLFDAVKIANLGSIRALKKDEWTIMLLEGFSDLDKAKAASAHARKAGFGSAHVVFWDEEKLRRVH